VQQIVIAHGGVVQVETPPSGGAIFRIILPAPASQTPP
jgi:signal transduction histidine kinase